MIILDYILESLALAFLFLSFLVVVFSYSKLPTLINLNLNYNLNPNNIRHKINLFFLPLMSFILYVLIAVIQKNPQHLLGSLNRDSISNERLVRLAVRYLGIVKFLISVLFFTVIYITIYNPVNQNSVISKVFFPGILIFLLMPLFLLIYRFATEFRKLVK